MLPDATSWSFVRSSFIAPAPSIAAASRPCAIQMTVSMVLASRGPEGFTMDAVAARAEVGKGTVFRRFGDREGLAAALLDEPMQGFQARVLGGPPPLGPGAPAADRLEAFLAELIAIACGDLDVLLIALNAPGHRRSVPFAFLRLHVEVLLREIGVQPSPELAARLLLGAVSPEVIADARLLGADAAEITSAVLKLLRGLTRG